MVINFILGENTFSYLFQNLICSYVKYLQYSSEKNETFTDVENEECVDVPFNPFSNRQVLSLVLSQLAVNQTGTYQCAILRWAGLSLRVYQCAIPIP